MMQGDFTKQEADFVIEVVTEVFKSLSIPKKKRFFGHFNDIFLFLEVAKRNAPNEIDSDRSPQSVG